MQSKNCFVMDLEMVKIECNFDLIFTYRGMRGLECFGTNCSAS